jgi:GGDEF domain-containing protein
MSCVGHQQNISNGRLLMRQGQYGAGIKEWLAGLAASQSLQDELPYWVLLGQVFREAKQAERALSLHQHAFNAVGDDFYLQSLIRMHLALDLLALGDAALAQKLLQQACQFERLAHCPTLQELLGEIYFALAQYELSAQALQLAIELYQDDAIAIAQCSLLLLKTYAQIPDVAPARLAAAIEIAHQHLALLPEQARQLAIELGRACEMLARPNDAAAYFKMALALPAPKSSKKAKPRRLSIVEYKLQQITSDIEIEMLREKNAAQHQQVKQLETAGFRDEVTGLYNSRYLAMRWADLQQLAQQGTELCLLNIAINLFASISEVLGKDLALLTYTQIGHILKYQCPDDAILVTSGTGAFELLLLDRDKTAVEQLIAQVQQKISQIEQVYLPEPLSISVGGAYFETHEARDVFQLRANLALFLAQRKESKQICWDGDE